MTNLKSMIERLLKKLDLAAPDAPLPAPVVVQPIPNPPLTPLEQDRELYESSKYLSIMDGNKVQQDLICLYQDGVQIDKDKLAESPSFTGNLVVED